MYGNFDDIELELPMTSDNSNEQDYGVGDEVSCKISGGIILFSGVSSWEDKKSYMIIGSKMLEAGTIEFIVYVPQGEYMIRDTFRLSKRIRNPYYIADKFEGEWGAFIRPSQIFRLERRYDGMQCRNCDEYYDMSEPNQENGTMICYLCRQDPWR
jgi:hypothetical protein